MSEQPSANDIDAWAVALDQFEERLAGFRSALEQGSQSTVAGMWPTPNLIGVPLPQQHAERARALMAKAKELEGQIIARKDELGPPRPTYQSRRKTPVSSFVTEL